MQQQAVVLNTPAPRAAAGVRIVTQSASRRPARLNRGQVIRPSYLRTCLLCCAPIHATASVQPASPTKQRKSIPESRTPIPLSACKPPDHRRNNSKRSVSQYWICCLRLLQLNAGMQLSICNLYKVHYSGDEAGSIIYGPSKTDGRVAAITPGILR